MATCRKCGKTETTNPCLLCYDKAMKRKYAQLPEKREGTMSIKLPEMNWNIRIKYDPVDKYWYGFATYERAFCITIAIKNKRTLTELLTEFQKHIEQYHKGATDEPQTD